MVWNESNTQGNAALWSSGERDPAPSSPSPGADRPRHLPDDGAPRQSRSALSAAGQMVTAPSSNAATNIFSPHLGIHGRLRRSNSIQQYLGAKGLGKHQPPTTNCGAPPHRLPTPSRWATHHRLKTRHPDAPRVLRLLARPPAMTWSPAWVSVVCQHMSRTGKL